MAGRILVVDDEADLRFVLRMFFERAGYDVAEAGDGAAALASVAESRPDLVVTDLMMPVMNGVELIRRLRSETVTAGIPVMVVSSNVDGASGADAILAKPFRRQDLLAMAQDLLKDGRDAR